MLVNTNIISKTTLAENPEEVYTRDYLYPPPTANELSALTCHQLQERLRDRHMPISGKKQELIDRLIQSEDTIPESYHEIDAMMSSTQAITPNSTPLKTVQVSDDFNSGLSPHRLLLKKNVCVILLRSIHPTKGFCNGRRCLLVDIRNNILVLRPLESENDDRHIFVPRIPMECTESRLGVPFMRRQYPILLAYYLTINRSQGQTLDVVGLELPTSVFMHGHTYVGCGRTGDPYGLHIYSNQEEFQDIRAQYLQDGVTYIKNEVWPELLLNE